MLEKDEIEKVILNKITYEQAFKKGYNYILYSDDPEKIDEPVVDYSSFDSIGYYDGFEYGDWCIRVGIQNDIKPDNLIAEMDKRFTQSLNKYKENISSEGTISKTR